MLIVHCRRDRRKSGPQRDNLLYRKNDDLRRILAGLFGKQGVLAVTVDRVEVAIRERVCHPEDLVHIALTFPSGVKNFNGELRIERAKLYNKGNFAGYSKADSHTVRYEGLKPEKQNVALEAPTQRGLYRIAYFQSGQVSPAGSDELFFQKTE